MIKTYNLTKKHLKNLNSCPNSPNPCYCAGDCKEKEKQKKSTKEKEK